MSIWGSCKNVSLIPYCEMQNRSRTRAIQPGRVNARASENAYAPPTRRLIAAASSRHNAILPPFDAPTYKVRPGNKLDISHAAARSQNLYYISM